MLDLRSTLALVTTALLGLASVARADVPPYVTIPPVVSGQANPSYGGSGCPDGSARAVVSPDRQSFTMIFDQYLVSASGSGSIDRKNCQILVNFDFPQGWSYSIIRLDYRGFFAMDQGTTGFQQSLYYFQGIPQQGRLRTYFTGPSSGDYTISDILEVGEMVWSPCGARRGLNINSSLFTQVKPGYANSSSMITNDSIDGSVKTVYILQWRRC
jgi:hypothetical protein